MGAKLVRDKMADIPWGDEDAKKYLRTARDTREHLGLLMQKLLEEIGELNAASELADIINEFGDVAEVLDAMGRLFEKVHGLPEGELAWRQAAKREERGSFDQGLVWDQSAYMSEG